MEKEWKTWEFDSCPNCGNALEVLSDCLAEDDDPLAGAYVNDEDDIRCVAQCGFKSCISADENDVWIQDGNLNDLKDENNNSSI